MAAAPVTAYIADAAIGGRYGYVEDCTALNFTGERGGLCDYLDRIAAGLGRSGRAQHLPRLDRHRHLSARPARGRRARLRDPVLAAYPRSRASGSATAPRRRRITTCRTTSPCAWSGGGASTLFPPDQVANLYPGPLEPTPAGQVVTMVDFRDPDLARFPAFADAMAAGEIAELEPGDALIYPALWWHQVEALDTFNVMINYWWNDTPAFVDTPMITLLHGLLSLRDRPESEKAAWRALFDYYVFGPADRAGGHLPPEARGALAPLDTMTARRLRADILRRMNR